MIAKLTNLISFPDTPRYNIKVVVQQTHINISTLRAWEQRYGVPQPQRSEHGHRLYSQRDIVIIAWLRQCTEAGLSIRQAIAMLGDTEHGAIKRNTRHDESTGAAGYWAAMRNQLLDALLDVNLGQAHMLVNKLCTLFPIETIVLELFRPVLVEIGAHSLHREVCIADERCATNFIRQRLLALIQLYAPFANGPRLICICPPGDQNEIDLLMFALLMEQRGWEVIYLGRDVTLQGLESFLTRQTPALLSLSVSLVEHVSSIIDICRIAELLQEHGLLIAYGGRVFDSHPDLAQQLPGVFLGSNLPEAAKRADALAAQLEQYRRYNKAAPAHDHPGVNISAGL